MVGYTKLFSSLVYSTIWREPDHVRLVWITMLCMADKNGNVEASIPGLADLARVDLEDCKDALTRLSSPDEYSRSQDFEGKRIEVADGGWLLLNYKKYRGKFVSEKIKEQNRLRQQKFRERQAAEDKVTHNAENNADNAHAYDSDYDSDYHSDSSSGSGEKKISKKNSRYTPEFEAFWAAYPKKKAKQHAFSAWTKQQKNGNWPGVETVMSSLAKLVVSPDWNKDGGQFVPYPATWLNGGGWDDEAAPIRPVLKPVKYDY